ncbi:unnamed protein product [Polarella glacialis]|uniref:Uncharacterized protein n=1 Tax=Polarella glacialis TaxID=89957 RepID=A0A813JV77_POLGL|nr:unnamed protein product [Polarella glacialis]|mmetsp:Transcript_62060/g.100383  ORF Transcript_62060/g.100383 Transcript_62060/m.100383 type:complete len:151 (-) Transcript_62060:293-745(-)
MERGDDCDSSPFGIAASWLPTAPRLGSFLLVRRLPTCWRRSVLRLMDIDILSFGASSMSKGKNNYFDIKENSRLSQGTHDRKVLKGKQVQGRRRAQQGQEEGVWPGMLVVPFVRRPERADETRPATRMRSRRPCRKSCGEGHVREQGEEA